MNKDIKIFGRNIAILALVALVATPFLIQRDKETDVAPSEKRETTNPTCEKLGGLVVFASKAEAMGYPESDAMAAAAINKTMSSGDYAKDREAIHWAYVNKPSGQDYQVWARGYNACGIKYAKGVL